MAVSVQSRVKIVDELIAAATHHIHYGPVNADSALEVLSFGLSILPHEFVTLACSLA